MSDSPHSSDRLSISPFSDLDSSVIAHSSFTSSPALPSSDLHSTLPTSPIPPLDPANMTDSTKHCEIGESNKLQGLQNYTVWKIKMEAIFRREKLWGLIETKQSVSVFPTTIAGIDYPSEERFHSEKQRARSGLILSVSDSLIGLVAEKDDPADSWNILRRMYNAGDQQQILFLTNKIHNLSLSEGGDVTAYLMDASNLRNHLNALGETISDRQLVNIVLNGLPRSFDMVVQGISYMPNPTFEDVMGKILMESQRMSLRDNKHGQEEALAVQFRPQLRPHYRMHLPHQHASTQFRNRGFARPSGLHYSSTPNQFRGTFSGNSPPAVRNFASVARPLHHSSSAHNSTGSGQPPILRPHLNSISPGQNFYPRFSRPPITCYTCGQPGHIH